MQCSGWNGSFVGRSVAAFSLVCALGGCVTAPQPTTPTKESAEPASSAVRSGSAIAADKATFSFFVEGGIPADRVDTLVADFGKAAKLRGVQLVKRNDPAAVYRIFASAMAFGDVSATHITYYLDIVDQSDVRVYRINGTEPAGATSSGDPWSNVSDDTLDILAVRAVNQLATWLRLPPQQKTFKLKTE